MHRVIMTIMLLSSPLLAAEEDWEKDPLNHCERNQYTLNVCAVEKFRIADKKLNVLYNKQLKHLESDYYRKSFQDAQRAWIKFRDKDCLYQAGQPSGTGSYWALEHDTCLTRHTERRIEDIKAYLECTQNGCPY